MRIRTRRNSTPTTSPSEELSSDETGEPQLLCDSAVSTGPVIISKAAANTLPKTNRVTDWKLRDGLRTNIMKDHHGMEGNAITGEFIIVFSTRCVQSELKGKIRHFA
ncbi:hypothetical protein Pr1d_18360 [Bythopirellula goksoeyrii]|uniref:Uncharacterized protein n=1 Tax=Bythopirellula goksoeyrii TaxID=1400387 RepID=A0A5B9QCB4_9BACT|nr:hypothetical protein Pr1d_18360 [Bythopirellula goksoeyrii]